MAKVPTAKVLGIDANPEVVDILATCLRAEGYGVLGALKRLLDFPHAALRISAH